MKVRIRFVKKKLSIVLGLIIVAVTFFTLTNQKTVSANSSRVETVHQPHTAYYQSKHS